MKVAFTSDIHIDITQNNKLLIPFIVNRIMEINPDLFVIAGDVSNTLEDLGKALSMFSGLNCLKVMVPGNHDVWIESNNSLRKGKDSFYKYYSALPEVCKENGFVCPIDKPFLINDTAIVGSIGWYDYSLADPRLASAYNMIDYSRGEFKEGSWNDIKYAVWLKSPESPNWRERLKSYTTLEMFDRFFNELKSSVQQIPDNIKNVLITLHTAPFKECIIPKEDPSPFDAYEGSTKIGEFIKTISDNKKVSIVCGHRHKKLFLDIDDNIKLYRSPIGYLDKSQTDYERIAQEVIGEFEM